MTGTRRELAIILPYYLVLAVLFTWPTGSHIDSHVPVTGSGVGALSGLYTLTWGIHALAHQPWHYFQCNVLYPHAEALAYGDHLFGMAVTLAPIQWILLNPTLTYNLAILLSFVIAATGAYLLGRHITGSVRCGLLAGLIYGFSAYRFSEIESLDSLGLHWLPWVFLVGHLYLEMPHRRLIYLGGFFALVQATSSTQSLGLLAASAAVALAYSIYRQKRRHRVLFWRHRAHFAVASVAILAVLSPFVKPYLDHANEERGWDPAAAGIAVPVGAPGLDVPGEADTSRSAFRTMGLVPGNSDLRPHHFPGFVAVILISLLAFGLLKGRDEDDHRIYFYAFLGAAAVLAQAVLPLPLGALISLSAGVLAAISYRRIEILAVSLTNRRPVRNVLVSGVLVVLAVELHPTSIRTLETVPRSGPPAEYFWIDETDPESVILELPATLLNAPNDLVRARRQLYSMYHWRRTIDGVPKRVPSLTRAIRTRLLNFPDDASIAQARALHADYLIIHLDEYGPEDRARVTGGILTRSELVLEKQFEETLVCRIE